MFESLSDRLSGVFDRLTKQGALSEADVSTALREVRVALLEADVSLPVARDFIKAVQKKAEGQAVTKSVTPGQQVVKIVHDELIATLRGDGDPGALKIDNPPAPILMVGLQGSGKTTTTAKLARRLKDREGKRVLMASLDVNRPAAMEQLAILGAQIGVDTLPIVKGEAPPQIAKRARTQAALGGYDVYLLDTAGRLHIDEVLMDEVQAVRDIVALVEKAQETLEIEQAERMMKRMAKGQFNMNDLRMQLEQMLKMGGVEGLMGMMPGMAKFKGQMDSAGFDDKVLRRQIALIQSMTKKERANPDILAASRKKRIAAGAGMEVSDLNKLLKMHRQMSDMMKKMGKKGMLKGGLQALMGKSGMPQDMAAGMDPKALEAAARQMGGRAPGGLPGLGGMGLPPGLSGFGKKK